MKQRIPLIENATPVSRHSLDNSLGDLIVYQNDTISDSRNRRYQIVDRLGNGQFGQVYQVIDLSAVDESPSVYALKITKSHPRYKQQANHEVSILRRIQENASDEDMAHISKLINAFEYHQHVCIVIELLSYNLYNILVRRNFRGLPLVLVQTVMRDCLEALVVIHNNDVIHSDIKPENILLTDGFSSSVKMIDFGSSRTITQPISYYIQSRYYRAPEVVLGVPHGHPIDVWSLGCVGAEIFLGNPLLPGQSEIHLIELIAEMFGPFPQNVIMAASRRNVFFSANGELKSEIQICNETGQQPTNFQKYFVYDTLPENIRSYQIGFGNTHESATKEKNRRELFISFLQGCLQIDPEQRITAAEALQHPFITSDFSE